MSTNRHDANAAMKALELIRAKAVAYGIRANDGYAEIQSIAVDALNDALFPAPQEAEDGSTTPEEVRLENPKQTLEFVNPIVSRKICDQHAEALTTTAPQEAEDDR